MTRKYQRKTLTKKAPSTAFKPGPDPRRKRGRTKGVPNRFTRDVREMLLNSLEQVGGEAYFVRSARRIPRSYLGLVGRLIPAEVTGKDGGPIEVQIQKAMGSLSQLTDKELAQLQAILAKLGLNGETP